MGRGLDGYFSSSVPEVADCAVFRRLPDRAGLSQFAVAIARGKHLFPFRTEQLSLSAPMVLGSQGPGRVGRRRFNSERPRYAGPFFVPWRGARAPWQDAPAAGLVTRLTNFSAGESFVSHALPGAVPRVPAPRFPRDPSEVESNPGARAGRCGPTGGVWGALGARAPSSARAAGRGSPGGAALPHRAGAP